MKHVGIVATLSMLAFTATVAQADGTTTVNFENAPSGTHFVTGFGAPVCTVDEATNTVTCTGTQLAGVGNTNATVSLAVTGTVTGVCHNPGNSNIVDPFTETVTETTTATVVSTKNGRLTIPAQSATVTSEEFLVDFTCPNPNWTAEVTDITISSFTYSVTFAGFTEPAILIDP
jgi:hypothetical protein